MRDVVCNRRPVCGILGEAMVVVPRWFCVVAHVFAVAFAVWLGLHLYAPLEWVAIFVVAAALSALLPYFRVVGFIGLVGGIAIAGAGTYLLRDVWHALSLDGLTLADRRRARRRPRGDRARAREPVARARLGVSDAAGLARSISRCGMPSSTYVSDARAKPSSA